MIEGYKTTMLLRDRRWLSFRLANFMMLVLVFLAIILILLLFMVESIFPDMSWSQLLAKLPAKIETTDWLHVFFNSLDFVALLLLGSGQIVYLLRAQKLERLKLSLDGIQYTSPLPSILKWLKPDWYIPWNQVRKIELNLLHSRAHHPNFVQMTFTFAAGIRRIQPFFWVDPEKFSPSIAWFKLTFTPMTQSKEEILKSVMQSEVAQYINRSVPNLTIESNLPQAAIQTSLEKDPHGRISIGIIVLLMTYAVVDYMMGPDSYIDDPANLVYIYISVGVAGALLSAIWLYKSTLAPAEKAGMAILIGALVAVAMIPGALRINALTDDKGPAAYDYYVIQKSDGVVLRPVVEGLPVIDYFASNNYWKKFGKDDTCQVMLRKGWLGFYQFNSSRIIEEIHQFEP